MRLRLWHVVLFVVVLILAADTAAVQSTVGADRDVAVPVVGDEEAYLAVSVHSPPELTDHRSEDVALLTVTNQFGPGVRLTVSGAIYADDASPPTVLAVSGPGTLDPGDSGTIRADFVCPEGERHTETFSVTILATDVDGTLVTTTRDVTVTCAVPAPPSESESTA